MLVGTPLPVNLSVFGARGPALWIRRVLVRAQEGQLTVIARVSRCFHVTQRRYLNGCERDLARLSKDGRGAARGRQAEASRPRVPKSWRCFVSGSEAPRSPVTRWENTASGPRSRDRG